MSGQTPHEGAEAGEKVHLFEEAGATWWVEVGYGFTLEEFRERIRRGPPRLLYSLFGKGAEGRISDPAEVENDR